MNFSHKVFHLSKIGGAALVWDGFEILLYHQHVRDMWTEKARKKIERLG